jgi:SH3 domain-containing YSC84-like protein 1
MRPFPTVVAPIVAAAVVTASMPAMASPTEDIQKANRTFQEFVGIADQAVVGIDDRRVPSELRERRIPPELLRDSQGIAIIPNIIRAGFIFGGRRGDGVLLVRNPDGSWSDPAFINITGGSIGLQAGAQASDVILVFRNQQNIARLLNRKVELGGDVAVAAGPVGKNYVSAIDPSVNIYSYTRNRGLFGGVALSGVNLSFDRKQSEQFYGDGVTLQDILSRSRTPVQPEVANLKATLSRYVQSVTTSR